jgi:hypothetical protein
MPMSVRERADWIATFRFTSIYLMETLARWVPSTPEMEVKLLFGRHLWEFAQHADAFGKRTAALRTAVHTSRAPTDAFMKVLERFAEAESAGERVDGLYDGIIPVLTQLYTSYMDAVDPLMDEPSIRIVERVITDLARMQQERRALLEERPDVRAPDSSFADELRAIADAASEVVDYRPVRAGEGSP